MDRVGDGALRASHPHRGRTAHLFHTAGGHLMNGKGGKMSARIKLDELPTFDAAPSLGSDKAIATNLTNIPHSHDAGLLSAALGDIARARGMTDIAKAAGITREALCKALRPGSAPRFGTVNRVCSALGVRWVVQSLHQA